MQRIKGLNYYQIGVLVVMLVMALVFAVVYPVTISKVGYRYQDAILVPTQQSGNTVYSGKIQRETARFVISEDGALVFQYGDKTYGPYTLREDPTAIPEEKDGELRANMTGIELREGETILFRGGILDIGDMYWLYNEDGTPESLGITYVTSDGVERDQYGNAIDRMKPSVSTIYELLQGPELTHKGEPLAWFMAAFLCVLNGLTVLFADELFRWNLSFQIRNVEHAEPSDLEIAGRYIGWTVLTVAALAIFLTGLQ